MEDFYKEGKQKKGMAITSIVCTVANSCWQNTKFCSLCYKSFVSVVNLM